MLGYLGHIVGDGFALALTFRTVVSALAKLDRLYLGRRAIDKAQRGELPAIMDALARWHQSRSKR